MSSSGRGINDRCHAGKPWPWNDLSAPPAMPPAHPEIGLITHMPRKILRRLRVEPRAPGNTRRPSEHRAHKTSLGTQAPEKQNNKKHTRKIGAASDLASFEARPETVERAMLERFPKRWPPRPPAHVGACHWAWLHFGSVRDASDTQLPLAHLRSLDDLASGRSPPTKSIGPSVAAVTRRTHLG